MKQFSILFFVIICLLNISANAQKKSKPKSFEWNEKADSVLVKLSSKMCSCLDSKNAVLEKTKSTEEFIEIFTGCLMEDGMKEYLLISKITNAEYNDNKEIGGKLALKMIEDKCESYISWSKKAAMKAAEFDKNEEVVTEGKVVGEIVSINKEGDYFTFTILSQGDAEKKVYLIEDFESSKTILKEKDSIVGKRVFCKFVTKSVYMKSFDYFLDVKMVTDFELL